MVKIIVWNFALFINFILIQQILFTLLTFSSNTLSFFQVITRVKVVHCNLRVILSPHWSTFGIFIQIKYDGHDNSPFKSRPSIMNISMILYVIFVLIVLLKVMVQTKHKCYLSGILCPFGLGLIGLAIFALVAAIVLAHHF